MGAFGFVIKVAVLTIAIVWVSQMTVGERTVEDHFKGFVHDSSVTAPLHKVAEGARKISQDGIQEFREFVGTEKSAKGEKASESETTRKASTFRWQGQN